MGSVKTVDFVENSITPLQAQSSVDTHAAFPTPSLHAFNAHALEVALNSLPIGISWARVEDQTIIFTNRKFTQLFGYVASDFGSIDDWIDRAYPSQSDQALARRKWGEYFQRPDNKESPVETIEIVVQCKSGELRTMIVSGIILPETGWALATFVDITERKRSEEDFKKLNAKL